MPPPNSLLELVRAGTFYPTRHHKLLGTSADLPWEAFADLQRRYRAAADLETKRAVAREFERLVRQAHEEAHRQEQVDQCNCPGCQAGLDPFTLEHFTEWAAGVVLDSGNGWHLEPFQEAFVTDLFAGYRECWLVVPEGNGKTTALAGLALHHCEHTPSGWVPVAASSREQAEIMYRQAEGFVLRSPRLKGIFRTQEGYRRVRCDKQGARIQIFAADDRTGDGVIPTLALVDELHRHRDLRLYRVWRGKLEKRGGQIATISTAGEPGSEFEETRERIRQTAAESKRDGCFVRAVSGGVVLHEWAVPETGDVEDMAQVKAANPFSGVTVEALGEKYMSPTMTLSHWRRFVCNLPTRADAAAITEAEWAAARTDDKIPEGEPIWAGLDLGWKWDTTALVPLWFRDPEYRLFGPARVLEPPRDGSSLDPFLVEQALRDVHARNPIHTVVMDMTAGEQLAQWIADELGAEVVDRTQSNMLASLDYARFMEALRQGWLRHSGDPGLTQHAMNAIARMLPGGQVRFDRPARGRLQSNTQERVRLIDALVAAAMVHTSAAEMGELEPPVMAAWG